MCYVVVVACAWMCSGVPSVFRCLVDAMESCGGSGVYRGINATLEATLGNMTAHCPPSCDQATAYNCSLSYYDRVVMSLVDGVDCPVLGRYLRLPLYITTAAIVITVFISKVMNSIRDGVLLFSTFCSNLRYSGIPVSIPLTENK